MITDLQADGKTVVVVGTEIEVLGVIAIADEVRPEAKRALKRLHELGVSQLVMLTGDNEGTARAIAEQVGVDDYRAELLPEEKVDAMEELLAEHEDVAIRSSEERDCPVAAWWSSCATAQNRKTAEGRMLRQGFEPWSLP